MGSIESAISKIHGIDEYARRDHWMNHIHPMVKLLLTCVYVALVVSIDKYQIMVLLSMGLYLLVLFVIGELSMKECVYRLRIVLPLVCVMGILNPFFDRSVHVEIGNIQLTGGMISFITLMIKGIYTVLAVYILVFTTSMDQICCALRMLHCPQIIVTIISLIYRYLVLLMEEAARMTQSYKLRAPGQKGIHYKVWGSMIGMLLLRTMDRAEMVYESMNLRGFRGEFYDRKKLKVRRPDIIYACIFTAMILILRFTPVFEMVGNLFV